MTADCFVTFRADNFEVGGLGESNSTPALGRGTVQLLSMIEGRTRKLTLHDVIYCPEAANNLMSVSRLDLTGRIRSVQGRTSYSLQLPTILLLQLAHVRGDSIT